MGEHLRLHIVAGEGLLRLPAVALFGSAPRLPEFTLIARAAAPVEEVWKLLLDPTRFPEWWTGIETLQVESPEAYTIWYASAPEFP